MKKRELQELRGKPEELTKKLLGLRAENLKSEAAIVSGKEKNLRVRKNIRRDIAQILSILSEAKGEKK
ncbi:50S ribosomal protein L29 [Candidatus Woesebacteria bacterium RIFCSPHIGHO2_01_FULL_44_21]|uniref:Large ribosomal subunit protein uL29 n=1 Tax=Candidatus Woesebacteria bacterium RIFCSPHIGHO2_01_FULL_44_21 TaxID=1802503 RepID=A0A1F7Z1A7_9BACT|nr:MAG: 50S ribosomal protein L29 [Candidatus Woesebacteria bacterium RIFCSPHIGHO2_01_FULL_44_21]OGM71480.1 MAG: 50S ribosomal protein L29 [Candidatus Woesebacteria bacterium RIFCSPLOWO2_01_FULL_44_24b]